MHKSINSEFPLSAFFSDQEFVEMQTSTALLIGHNEHIADAPILYQDAQPRLSVGG